MRVYDTVRLQDSYVLLQLSDMIYRCLFLLRCVVNCIILHFAILNVIFQSLAHLVKVFRSSCSCRWSSGVLIG